MPNKVYLDQLFEFQSKKERLYVVRNALYCVTPRFDVAYLCKLG